jgi:hypothetical protein
VPEFNANRNQDAWATIRGFKYQIDLTLLRWLELTPDAVLELERGEDIDHVARSLNAAIDTNNEGEQDRILEQVKHREGNLTLRSDEAISALVNFVAAVKKNPTVDLRYRYTTNTKPGLERPPVTDDRKPAIELWEQLRLGKLDVNTTKSFIHGLRVLLSSARQPPRLQKDFSTEPQANIEAGQNNDWATFLEFVNGPDDALLKVVQRFEWATLYPEAPELQDKICQSLLEMSFAIHAEEALEKYQCLFLFVIELLCQPAIKLLTRDLLQTQLELSVTASKRDRAAMAASILLVRTQLQSVSGRVDQQEQQIQVMQKYFKTILPQGLELTLMYMANRPELSLPIKHEYQVSRDNLVNRVIDEGGSSSWIAIEGAAFSGKSEFALLLEHRFGRPSIWLRAEIDDRLACLQLDRALESLCAGFLSDVGLQRYARVAELLGPQLIIIDNLPRLVEGEYSRRLSSLASEIGLYGGKIITTSEHPLYSKLIGQLGAQLYVFQLPPFDEGETRALLERYGMSTNQAQQQARGLMAITSGHPWKLCGVAAFLRDANWELTEATFGALLRDQYGTDLTDDTLERLLRSADDETRELLYRLNAVVHDFEQRHVSLIAGIAPTVTKSRERFHALLGPWIERHNGNRFAVSPPAKRLGTDNLLESTRIGVHLVLAEDILKDRILDESSFSRAYAYLLGAREFDRAGGLLFFVLSNIKEKDDLRFIGYYEQTQLPQEMSITLQFAIRSRQFGLYESAGKSLDFLIHELDRLSQLVTVESAWVLLGTFAAVGLSIARKNLGLSLRLATRAVSWLPVTMPDGYAFPSPRGEPLEGLIWFIVDGVRNGKDALEFIAAVESFGPETHAKMFEGLVPEMSARTICDRVWSTEVDKPLETRNWTSVLETLTQIEKAGKRLEFPLLSAWAVIGSLVVHAEYQKNLDFAVEIAQKALRQLHDEPRGKFAIQECISRQFLYEKRDVEALPWLLGALDEPTIAYPHMRVDVLLNTARVVGWENAVAATGYASESVELARNSESVPKTWLVKALGELAISLWAEDRVLDAYLAIEEGTEIILKTREDSADWKETFLMHCHVAVHLSQGNSIKNAIAKREYPIYRGILNMSNAKVVQSFSPDRERGIYSAMCTFAQSIGDDAHAGQWALRGLDALEGNITLLSSMTFVPPLITQLILENRFSEVLDVALSGGSAFYALRQLRDAANSDNIPEAIQPGFAPSQVLGDKPNELWNLAEYQATFSGIVPAAFRIGMISLTDPAKAAEYATELIGACHLVAVNASDPSLWEAVANVLKAGFVDRESSKVLVQLGNTFAKQEWNSLRVIAYLASTLDPQMPPRDAVRGQQVYIPWATEFIGTGTPTLFRRFIVPFVEEYWRRKFEEQRFLFTAPNYVAQELEAAYRLPIDSRAEAIVNVISSGVGL